VLQQQAASAAAAASKTQREVYVGNLAMGIVTEEVLRTLFNNTLRAAFPAECAGGMEPVVNVNMHSDGRYSFVEMRTPEMATEALKISGLNLLGMPISCGRPSGYVDPAAVAAQAAEAARALQLFQAGGAAPGATAAMPATILPGPPALPAGVTLPGPPALPAGTRTYALPPQLCDAPMILPFTSYVYICNYLSVIFAACASCSVDNRVPAFTPFLCYCPFTTFPLYTNECLSVYLSRTISLKTEFKSEF
jgi:hypothetical protein